MNTLGKIVLIDSQRRAVVVNAYNETELIVDRINADCFTGDMLSIELFDIYHQIHYTRISREEAMRQSEHDYIRLEDRAKLWYLLHALEQQQLSALFLKVHSYDVQNGFTFLLMDPFTRKPITFSISHSTSVQSKLQEILKVVRR